MTPDRQFSDPRLADLYDLGNAGSEDRDFYLRLAGTSPKRVLDLGCGTGLLALAVARQGHSVVGVDPAGAMLDVAKRDPAAHTVTWVNSPAEQFSSERAFDLIIMTGHAFQVLQDDAQVEATLRTMKRHLKSDGYAVFESRNPELDWDAIWAREYEMQTPEGRVRAARRLTDTSRAPEFLSFAWDYQFEDDMITSDSTLRFMTRSDIIAMAEQAGLSLFELFGDWDSTKFDPKTSREMIFKFGHNPPAVE